MNSKEALERLVGNKVFISLGRTQGKKQFVNDINIIEKDLDVLDILKNESDSKRIIERDGIVSFHLDMILTADNYNKIKEWLENDK